MGQYTVKHQSDKTCHDCDCYDFAIVRDSFGELIQEYCKKGKYEHVGWASEACEEYKHEDTDRLRMK